MRHLRFLPKLLAVAATASIASAQVTAIGPFTGDQSEGFETQSTGVGGGHSAFQPCIVGRVLGGTADLCTTSGNAQLLVTTGWSFRCVIQEHSGAYFTGSAGDPVEFIFDADQSRFGAYLGTNSWNPGQAETVTVEFYDAAGTLIDSVIANVTDDCTWTWNGWERTQGDLARVLIRNSAFSGGFVDIDDVETSGSSLIGMNYCMANPNSSGQAASMSASGSLDVATNSFSVSATSLPQNSNGYFLASTVQANVMNPAGSQGNLCVGGTIARFDQQVQNAGTSGEISIQVDLTSIPQPAGPAIGVQPGETWNFTAWFRDANPNVTSNFADGLEVTFL